MASLQRRAFIPYDIRADAAVGSKFFLSPFALELEVTVSGCWNLKVFLSSVGVLTPHFLEDARPSIVG